MYNNYDTPAVPPHLLAELNHLLMVCKMIMMVETSNSFEDHHKYRMIFSTRILRRVNLIADELDRPFDYYNPDGTYTEDCNAFISGLETYISKLKASNTGIITHAAVMGIFEQLPDYW